MRTCLYCRGVLAPREIRHAVVHGSRVLVFSGAPALVCRQCGEAFFTGNTVDRMNRFAWLLGGAEEEELSVHFHDLALAG